MVEHGKVISAYERCVLYSTLAWVHHYGLKTDDNTIRLPVNFELAAEFSHPKAGDHERVISHFREAARLGCAEGRELFTMHEADGVIARDHEEGQVSPRSEGEANSSPEIGVEASAVVDYQ
ncbi:MAG: hypothetical protein COB66_07540 [Coxiella sp. (in: Bacteria)]|nr:MAG: hypothetical protein COB66_07540 [Coxiella sp. (in: g-proteobacteria)]